MRKALAALALVAVIGTGCASSAAKAAGSNTVLRLGVFPNLTHAPALVGISKGIIQKDLGANTKLKIFTFTSGSEASNAMLAGSIDATYIGPGPTTSLFSKSGKIAVVSGRCFAGNASFAGMCEILICTRDANIGMGGPAMIEGGGLGVFAPTLFRQTFTPIRYSQVPSDASPLKFFRPR